MSASDAPGIFLDASRTRGGLSRTRPIANIISHRLLILAFYLA